MKCPGCNNEMEWGKTYLKGTFGGFVFFGWSFKHCYFDSFESETKNIKIIDNDESKKAFFCKKCGMVVIPPER